MLTISVYADSASVLPKGVLSPSIESKFYLPIDERFDPDGGVESAATDYNATLNSNAFAALSTFDNPVFGLSSPANVGDSVVNFILFAYGITEKLTAAINIPYWWVKNNVDSRLDTTNANIGKSALANNLAPLTGPFAPPDVQPLTKEDVLDLLSDGLDINGDGTVDVDPGLRYKRFETWSNNGIGDIDALLKYQYLKNNIWRLALGGGVRFPTGEIDDPDNLVDYGIGSGTYAILFRLYNDYIAIEKLRLNTTFRYDLYLRSKEVIRVPNSVNRPITSNKEEIDKDIGDKMELEASASYELVKGLNLSALYQLGYKLKNRVEREKGNLQYDSLEDETEQHAHMYIVGLSYSTVPLYMEKKVPVPFIASVSYRNRFAGANNVLKSEYIGLIFQFFL
jgi:hypothetical protein